jgi:hypothetical protein
MNNSEGEITRREMVEIGASFLKESLHPDLIPLSHTQNIMQPTTYRQVS